MGKVTSSDRCCEVCGKPIQRNNTAGICSGGGTAECLRQRAALERRAKGIPQRKRNECTRPGCHRARKRDGVCAMHWSRFERTGEYGPGEVLERDMIKVRTGETFGSWTVLADGEGVVNRVPVRCECGTERRVLIGVLNSGRSLSCGTGCEAQRDVNPYLRPGIYGRLAVLETGRRARDLVRVRCECGAETTKRAEMVKTGRTTSCGCRSGNITHGLSCHPLYGVWNGMLDRCTNPRATGYEGWGGRGIKVCERWLDPAVFIEDIEREIGPRPDGVGKSGRALYELDRIDNDGNYEPGNVRWADRKTQAGNRRSVAKLTRQRDELLARLEAVTKSLTTARKPAPVTSGMDPLF